MSDHPTLAEQRAANLETNLTDAIRLAIRDTGKALKVDRTAAAPRVHRKKTK